MGTRSLLKLLALTLLVAGLVLSLSGCGGGSSQSIDTTESAVEESASTPAEPVVEEQLPSDSDQEEATPVPVVEDPVDQPLLSWARDAGGLSYCDRLSIYPDGRVEAVACRAAAAEPTVFADLSEEQLSQVLAWVEKYAPFTRRESEMSSAVRATTLHGIGSEAPPFEIKEEISTFAADIFLGLTEPE